MRISDWSSDVCSSDLFLKLTPRGEMVLDTEYYSEEPVRVGGSGDDGEDDHGDDASGDGSAGSGSSHTPPAPPPEAIAPGGKPLSARLYDELAMQRRAEIGRASCRERACQYG